ncbi:DUF4349 domain-containing protein [Pengzhenrongella frigida]|nr:DUF4349 domain-containing protein [Cellulomonas sp. HLT2-17]
MRRIAVPVVLLLLGGGLLTGCSASSDSSLANTSVADEAGSLGEGAVGAVADVAGDVGAAVGTVAAIDRQVVTSGSVSLVVRDPAASAQRASELTEAAGGRVDERVEVSASDERSASARLVVRIPAPKVTETLEQLKALGEVGQVQLTATDVTGTAQDLDARISALMVSVGRLEALMGVATTSDDLLALESTLAARQGDLEAKQAERGALAGQVALATITLDLQPEAIAEAEATTGPSGFWSALGTGWGSLVAALRGVLIAVGVLLPWAVFLGAVAAVILVARRVVRRRRSPTATSMPEVAS